MAGVGEERRVAPAQQTEAGTPTVNNMVDYSAIKTAHCGGLPVSGRFWELKTRELLRRASI